MKSKEEIERDVMKSEVAPSDYNLLEIYCFLNLQQLMKMYHNNRISKEGATKNKLLIFADYEKSNKDFSFQNEIYKEHIKHIKDTEIDRIKLRKILNDKTEITEDRMCEIINTCMSIISTIFKGEF